MAIVRGELYILTGPSGVGKTTLTQNLVRVVPGLKSSVSHTTRPRRTEEIDGVHYFFVNAAQFSQLSAQGFFLEEAQIFGNSYGTSRTFVEEELNKGYDLILTIDWQGARSIRQQMECVTIFLLPPSIKELSARLNFRADTEMASVEARLQSAPEEIAHYKEFDYLVISDKFSETLTELEMVILVHRLSTKRQAGFRQKLLEELMAKKLP